MHSSRSHRYAKFRYVLLGMLGRGGMGEVHLARDELLGRRVALKLLRTPDARPATQARLLREAQALARLSHPNVVAIHEAGEHDGRVYLAMELVVGETLRDWLRARRPAAAARLEAALQAGRGLAAAHDRGLVHRDFKPKSECPPQTSDTRRRPRPSSSTRSTTTPRSRAAGAATARRADPPTRTSRSRARQGVGHAALGLARGGTSIGSYFIARAKEEMHRWMVPQAARAGSRSRSSSAATAATALWTRSSVRRRRDPLPQVWRPDAHPRRRP